MYNNEIVSKKNNTMFKRSLDGIIIHSQIRNIEKVLNSRKHINNCSYAYEDMNDYINNN